MAGIVPTGKNFEIMSNFPKIGGASMARVVRVWRSEKISQINVNRFLRYGNKKPGKAKLLHQDLERLRSYVVAPSGGHNMFYWYYPDGGFKDGFIVLT